MRYNLCIFDMDGTTLDTLKDLQQALNYALSQFGYPTHPIEAVRGFVGNGLRNLIKNGLPAGTDDDTIDRVLEIYHPFYAEHCFDFTGPYDGVTEMIRELRAKGIATAIVSNKADYAVQALCERFFPGCFDYCIGEKEGLKRKPAPDMVEAVIKSLGADPDRCIYIGDSEVDIDTANNCGIDQAIVTWGFRDREYLAEKGAENIFDTIDELYRFLIS